jgi:3-phenylpropionate/cinnamic acid dioxygenase small subunit
MAKKPRLKSKKSAAAGRNWMKRPLGRNKRSAAQDTPDLASCEHFLLQEARLLDEARFDDWLKLFTPDAWYWVPSQPDQPDPHETVSLIYDDRRLLETRVRRLASPRMYSQEPRSRTSRLVANVTIEEAESTACTVRSKFVMIEFRRDSQRIFGGTAFHRLVQTESGLRIAWKRVHLVNCDAPMDGITIPF